MSGQPRQWASAEGRAPTIAASVLVLVGCLIVARAARNLTFSGDDWTFILDRRGFSAAVFLRPHNEHLSALPILAYKVLLQLFGASSYAPFMALLLFVHGVACLLLYVLARGYVGPWAALAPTAVLVVLGPAWQDLLWAFQVGYLGSVAAGLGMVLCLDRRDRPGDVAAAGLLAVSLLCSSVGLAMVVLAVVLLLFEQPRAWRRLWVVGVTLVLYASWYAVYGVSTARSQNIARIPKYLAQALSASLGSVIGLAQTHVSPFLVATSYGRFVALAAVGLLVIYLFRGGRLPPLAWAALAAAVALWTAECLEYFPGGREAAQSRYQYVGAALVLVAAVSIARGRVLSARTGAVLAGASLLICGANISMLNQRSGFWSGNSAYTAAETGSMEVARDVIAPNFVPEDSLTIAAIGNHNLQAVEARPYFSAVDAFGSAADSPRAILHRRERIREAADLILASAERLSLQPVSDLSPRGVACRSAQAGPTLGEVTVHPGPLTVRVQRGFPAELQLRRFASDYRFVRFGNAPPPFARARLQDGTTMVVQLPPDRSSIPWRAHLVGGRGVLLCVSVPS